MQAKPRDGRGVDAPGWALGTRDPHGSGTLTQSRWDAPREYQPTPLEQCVGSPHGAALSPMVGLVTSPSPGLAHGDSVGYFTWSEALGEGKASFSSSDALQMGSPTSLWVLSCSATGSLSLGYREDPNHDSDELSHRAAGQQGRVWGCWAKVISAVQKGKQQREGGTKSCCVWHQDEPPPYCCGTSSLWPGAGAVAPSTWWQRGAGDTSHSPISFLLHPHPLSVTLALVLQPFT